MFNSISGSPLESRNLSIDGGTVCDLKSNPDCLKYVTLRYQLEREAGSDSSRDFLKNAKCEINESVVETIHKGFNRSSY